MAYLWKWGLQREGMILPRSFNKKLLEFQLVSNTWFLRSRGLLLDRTVLLAQISDSSLADTSKEIHTKKQIQWMHDLFTCLTYCPPSVWDDLKGSMIITDLHNHPNEIVRPSVKGHQSPCAMNFNLRSFGSHLEQEDSVRYKRKKIIVILTWF